MTKDDDNDKTHVYSRLSNICRKATVEQSRQNKSKTVRKRSLPSDTKMTITQKRLRRTSDICVSRTVTNHDKSHSRKAKIKSVRRATFPTTSSVRDLKSATKKPKEVVVVDLFGEAESLFGCNVLSYATLDHSRKVIATLNLLKIVEPARVSQKHHDHSTSLRFVSSDENVGCIRDANTSEKCDDASNYSSKAAQAPHIETITRLVDMDDTNNDQLDHTEVPASYSFEHDNNDQADEVEGTRAQNVAASAAQREPEQSMLLYPSPTTTTISSIMKSQSFNDLYDDEDESALHPLHGEYFVQGNDGDDSSSVRNPATFTESLPLHDHYYGQESFIGTHDADDYDWQPPHSVFFGQYDDDNSSVRSQLEFISLINPATTIPYYDYYFGQEAYLTEDDIMNETNKAVAGRIPRYFVQSQPLLVIVLLAGMLSGAL